MSLEKILEDYSKSNMYPFHMPGHKRMLDGPYKIDMTEVDGVDDLHDPEEVIAEEQERLAKIYGADKSFILVGGSTVGNLAAIYSSCSENDLILIQRNSHKSVYNGAILRHLKVGYINSKADENGIYRAATLEEIKSAVEKYGRPKAILLTSPTYEGYHCKLDEISKYCYKEGIILIVDQAHGAHLGFNDEFKESAVGKADITIQSLHKTLPALTQTAVMHVSGNRVDSRKIAAALDIFETSSPSYVLMNSISHCMTILEQSADMFRDYVDNLQDFYKTSGQLKHLKIVVESGETKDPGKLVIITKLTNISGVELARILREKYEIETELSSFSYLLAMTSIMDSREGFERLKKALLEIDEELENGNVDVPMVWIDSEKIMEPWEAKKGEGRQVNLSQATGFVCQDEICLYPPGAPVVVPGEVISAEAIKLIRQAKECGIHVTGINNDCIYVVN
ncbi:aminotransferase class I/II-fold pyridoxal phosphate-dependent enzyme [Pseudobutyrivibrio ruminis]|uniref:Arginine/lysine/ornithine decarboxylase n=1 Tax=Pseudobutyrivibrio ruminis DSM 9787 TaxID=1123011 RepID=A0A285SR30_9FIRM|nr:aminotransferase class I/II-fold pyridoxal phosphate-dependent enzyme [Pseudobutyrivibrio ruminis]SOC10397.1 Arginine/lysine/ornithine decarboxylase [Pseudobutyrivibrio ruminis DSM 9787]